jgi:linoleoyl-CoA desaturase
MTTEAKIQFVNVGQSNFYPILKERVDKYFDQNEISPYANSFMIFKIVFFIAGLAGSYSFLVFGNPSLVLSYFLWILLGLFTAFAGVNIGHDALHGALSSNQKVNKVFGHIFDIAGASSYLWDITHNQIHHTYTNIQDYDEDISTSPLIRMSPHQDLRKIHRYQHWYTLFLYGLTSLSWVFVKDYKRFFQKQIANYKLKKPSASEYFTLFFFKALYYSVFLVIPLIFIDFSWWHILLGFVIMHFFEGISLALIIQMAHMVEGIDFPVPDEKGKIENAWAIHQMNTTADYARNKPLVSFFFGGLNFHIEHHLFQRVCHVHHKELSHIVERTAMEFAIPYHQYPTLSGAVYSHLKFLKRMGRDEYTVVEPNS